MKDLRSGEIYQVVLPADEDPVEYPASFFEKGQKPKLTICTKVPLEKLRGFVASGLKTETVLIQHINSYLYLVLKGIQEKNEGKWESFGITIAEDGATVNPFCMYSVTEDKDKGQDGKESTEASLEDDKWLPMFILGLYRIGKATIPDYRATLMRNLITQCMNMSGKAKGIVRDTSTFFETWANDLNFTKIVAAVDMFFYRFKRSNMAPIRFGTIVSRFKDCAALATFGHLSKTTGLNPNEVAKWVNLPCVLDELIGLMRPNNEIDKPYSYMPYLVDMGLSRRSPYSAVKNPSFHFWGQLTALLLRSNRAKNARVPSDIPLSNLTISSWLFAFAIGRSADLQILVGDDNESMPQKCDSEEDLSEMPANKVHRDWMAWYEDIRRIPTKEMRHFAKAAVSSLSDIRDGTVGKYAKNYFESV